MKRTVKDLPKTFHPVKVEFERLLNLFWSTKLKDGKRNETKENLTLLYVLAQEYQKFVELQVCALGDKVLEAMHESSVYKVFLYDFGKKLFWDDEARWLFLDDLNSDEWRDYDSKCNKEYLENLKNKK